MSYGMATCIEGHSKWKPKITSHLFPNLEKVLFIQTKFKNRQVRLKAALVI